MRGFLTGVVFGGFVTVWAMDALPTRLGVWLDDKIEPAVSWTQESPEEAGGPAAKPENKRVRRTGVFQAGHLSELYTCPGMTRTNIAQVEASGRLTSFKPYVKVNGVTLAAAPVSQACLSSGFGTRSGKLHKGVDYHSEAAAQVYAAGAGVVREAEYRSDYGYMIVVDHGTGVYTRYAHLKKFAGDIHPGVSVSGTTRLGAMGSSAGYSIPQHLHFELLLGDYETAAKSFGLTPKDILSY